MKIFKVKGINETTQLSELCVANSENEAMEIYRNKGWYITEVWDVTEKYLLNFMNWFYGFSEEGPDNEDRKIILELITASLNCKGEDVSEVLELLDVQRCFKEQINMQADNLRCIKDMAEIDFKNEKAKLEKRYISKLRTANRFMWFGFGAGLVAFTLSLIGLAKILL